MSEDGPPAAGESARRRLERTIPLLLRRAVEVGLDRLADGPESVRQALADLKLPRDVVQVVLGQLEDTRSGVVRAVTSEVRQFLEKTNLADELVRALTAVSFEIKTEIRFVPSPRAERRGGPAEATDRSGSGPPEPLSPERA